MDAKAEAVWFGPSESPLFGVLHMPEGPSRGAIVLCPPLGREYTNSYSTFVRLASRLSQLGFVALRFDYRSTGDSFDRVPSVSDGAGFTRDVALAIELVRSMGLASIGLVGMRLGANFALNCCALSPEEALVLWDPCPTGRSFLREQRVLGLIASSRVGRERLDAFDLPGFELNADMSEEISAVDLLGDDALVAGSGALAGRVLLLTRSGRDFDGRLAERFALPHAQHKEVAGQPELLEVQSPDQIVPDEGLEAVANWLDEVMPRSPEQVVARPQRSEASVVVSADGCDADGGLKKVAVAERAVRLGPAGLFGIETEPDTGSEGPTCVFFSVANEHRIGPGRLWVRLSRDLAGEGFRSVRVDVNGFGDSSPPGGEPEPPVHSAQAIDDVLESARAVSPADPSEVVLFGLCSSGYQILEAALSLAPQGVCALNPALVFEPPEIALAGSMDARRRFCLPESGLVNAASERQPLQWLRRRFPTLMSKARRTARLLALRMRRAVGLLKNRPGERLGDLVGAGTDVFLICGPQEIEPLFETGLSQERRAVRSDRLQIEVLPSLQHSLLSVRDRNAVTRLVLEHVREHFQGFPHDAGAQAVARPDGR